MRRSGRRPDAARRRARQRAREVERQGKQGVAAHRPRGSGAPADGDRDPLLVPRYSSEGVTWVRADTAIAMHISGDPIPDDLVDLIIEHVPPEYFPDSPGRGSVIPRDRIGPCLAANLIRAMDDERLPTHPGIQRIAAIIGGYSDGRTRTREMRSLMAAGGGDRDGEELRLLPRYRRSYETGYAAGSRSPVWVEVRRETYLALLAEMDGLGIEAPTLHYGPGTETLPDRLRELAETYRPDAARPVRGRALHAALAEALGIARERIVEEAAEVTPGADIRLLLGEGALTTYLERDTETGRPTLTSSHIQIWDAQANGWHCFRLPPQASRWLERGRDWQPLKFRLGLPIPPSADEIRGLDQMRLAAGAGADDAGPGDLGGLVPAPEIGGGV